MKQKVGPSWCSWMGWVWSPAPKGYWFGSVCPGYRLNPQQEAGGCAEGADQFFSLPFSLSKKSTTKNRKSFKNFEDERSIIEFSSMKMTQSAAQRIIIRVGQVARGRPVRRTYRCQGEQEGGPNSTLGGVWIEYRPMPLPGRATWSRSAVQLSTLSHLSPPSESTGSPSGVLTTHTFTKGLDKAKKTLGASYR